MLRYRIRAATSVINRLAQSVGRYGFSEETSSVNRREIYNLLFQSAWAAIKQTVESEQGYQPAALMVLHSWNQKLEAHGHVHAVVPGGGPALDGSGWRTSQRRPEESNGTSAEVSAAASGSSDTASYLVDAIALRRCYRREFLKGLERLWKRGELKLTGEFDSLREKLAWRVFIGKLKATEWVSYIQPPPQQANNEPSSAESVMKYLARYLTGGPISDHRLISADARSVTFWAREGTTTGGDSKQIPVTLSRLEFTRRWCLHILPDGFTKSRTFGG